MEQISFVLVAPVILLAVVLYIAGPPSSRSYPLHSRKRPQYVSQPKGKTKDKRKLFRKLSDKEKGRGFHGNIGTQGRESALSAPKCKQS